MVAGLERERRMHQIQIHRLQAQPVQAGLQRAPHPFGPVVVVPQLRGDEELVATDGPGREQLLERRADLRFVAIAFGRIEVAESDLDRGPDGVARLVAIGKRCPEAQRRNLTAAVVQRESVPA